MSFEETCVVKLYNNNTEKFDEALFKDILYCSGKIFYFESLEACNMAQQIIKDQNRYDYYDIIFKPKVKYYVEEIECRDDYDELYFKDIIMPIDDWIAKTQKEIRKYTERLKFFQDIEKK